MNILDINFIMSALKNLSRIQLALVLCLGLNSAYGATLRSSDPAYKFWSIARKASTTDQECERNGGRVIKKFEYIQNIDQGIGVIKDKSDGRMYLSIAYGDENFLGLVTVKQCGFPR